MLFTFVILSTIYGLIIEEKSLLYVALDVKVVFTFLFSIIIIVQLRGDHFDFFDSKLWRKSLLVNFIIDTFLFLLNQKYNIAYKLTGDGHYLNEVGRYADLSVAFLVLYLIYKFVKRSKFSLPEIVFVIFPIIYSGNRTLIFSVSLIIVFYILFRVSLKKKIILGSFILVLVTFFMFLTINSNEESFLFRIKSIGDPDFITEKLEKRFEPVMVEIKDWDRAELWLFGKGLGKAIYIPWFEYRDNIDNYNPFMDNIYLTLFIKFGFFSILIYFFLYKYFYNYSKNKSYSIVLMAYLLIMGITTAFLYQATFLVFLISPPLLRKLG